MMEAFNTTYAKKHVQSNLCSAKNDDPAGRTTCLLEAGQAHLAAADHEHAGPDSAQSRQGNRRAWSQRVNLAKHNANLAERWQGESAIQWITSYAEQLRPRTHDLNQGNSAGTEAPPVPVNYKDPVKQSMHLREPDYRVRQGLEVGGLSNPDTTGDEVYETVKQLMKTQNIQGDPQDFLQAYKKELATVTTMRLKEVSPAVAQYVRAKKLAVRLRMILTEKKDQRRKGRLVLQGFRAPSWWRVGSTDSPVVATAGLRVLIFRRDKQVGRREIVSQFDFDVAFLQANGFAVHEPTRHVSYKPHPGYPEQIYELTGPLYGSDDAPMRSSIQSLRGSSRWGSLKGRTILACSPTQPQGSRSVYTWMMVWFGECRQK